MYRIIKLWMSVSFMILLKNVFSVKVAGNYMRIVNSIVFLLNIMILIVRNMENWITIFINVNFVRKDSRC